MDQFERRSFLILGEAVPGLSRGCPGATCHLGFYSVCESHLARLSRAALVERNAHSTLSVVFVLRFQTEAELCQMEFRLHPTMVSLPLDARRAKCTCGLDGLDYLTYRFALVRRSPCDMHPMLCPPCLPCLSVVLWRLFRRAGVERERNAIWHDSSCIEFCNV